MNAVSRAKRLCPPYICGEGGRGIRCSAAAAKPQVYAFFATGTGTPAIFTLNEPRLARVQK